MAVGDDDVAADASDGRRELWADRGKVDLEKFRTIILNYQSNLPL